MEKLYKSTKRKNRIKKIIFSSAMVITMAVFFISGFSADEVVYLNKTISAEDFAALSFLNSSVKYSYTDLSDQPFLSLFGESNINLRVTYDRLPYTAQGFISDDSLFWQGVIFTSDDSTLDKRVVMSLSPNFDLYFDDFNLDLFIICYDYSSFSFQYLDDDSNLVTIPFTREQLGYTSIYLFDQDNPGYIDSNYFNYVLNNKYYTQIFGSQGSYDTGLTRNTTYRFYKFHLNFSNLNKTKINSILISMTLNVNSTNHTYPRYFPYIKFLSDVPAFIKSSQDQVYTEQLALQREISQKLSNIQNAVSGPVSSDAQATLDDLNDDFEQKQAQLQDDLDIIHSVEFPTDQPTNYIPQSDLQYITDNIAPIFADLSSLQIFNIIVPTGCVGFLIFICIRRF